MRRLVVVSSVLICAGIFVLSAAGSLGVAALGILLRGMGGVRELDLPHDHPA